MGSAQEPRGSAPRSHLGRLLGGGLLVAAASLAPVAAARLEVVLQTPQGERLSGQRVELRSLVSGGPPCSRGLRSPDDPLPERTDWQGTCVFDGLAPGSYAICGRFGPGIVDPAENPLGPPRTVTLSGEDDQQRVTVELWRGARLVVRMTSERAGTPKGTLRLHERALSIDRQLVLRDGEYQELDLLPGTWEVGLEPPSGFTIVRIEVDGEVHGELPVTTVLDESRTTFVEWRIAAPCTIEGRVVTRTGPAEGVSVFAERVAAGAGVEGALAGAEPERVEGGTDTTGWFEIKLPDGLWRVMPGGTRVESSEPAQRELRLRPGQSARADFEVQLREESRDGLRVRVQDPDRRSIGGAWVEVWSLSPSGEVGERLGEAVTAEFTGGARVPGISAGNLRVFAGHDAWLDGHADLHIEAGEKTAASALVTLGRGGSIRVTVVDAADAPVSGVSVTATPADSDAGETGRPARRPRTARADLTGYAKLEGLADGVHRLTATLEKNSSGRFLRWSGNDDEPGDETSVDLAAGEHRDLTLRVLPAAEIGGRVLCADRGRLPAAIGLRVVSAASVAGCDVERARDGAPGLVVEGHVLEGQPAERFRAGPLSSGDYAVAVRPGGFESWTWLGTKDPCDPAVVQLTEGELTDIGTIEVDCLPVVRITPVVVEGTAALPDLRQAGVSVLAWQKLGDGTEQPLDSRLLTVTQQAAALEIRGAPEGSVRLLVSVRFPSLPAETWETTLDLREGHTAPWSP